MAKPEEVLVVENEQGEVVREFMKDTDAINNYKNMRETLGMINPLSANHTEWLKDQFNCECKFKDLVYSFYF